MNAPQHRRPRPAAVAVALACLAAAAAAIPVLAAGSASAAAPLPTAYDSAVLADQPIAFWSASDGRTDATGRGHDGTAVNGTGQTVLLPNGQAARTYDGASQYVEVPSSAEFSVPTTRALTWEVWIRPSTLQFAKSTGGYIDFLGKCASYSPTCEWEGRMYNLSNAQNRPSRISGYIFNPSAGLGSAADWQPASGTIAANRWIHVVTEYQTITTPSQCNAAYPGTINIWVDGIKQSFESHAPTGCMSQYSITPKTLSSPLRFGTMAKDSYFAGAIGKAAIYPRLLTPAEITEHFTAMTGLTPSGTCASTCSLSVQPSDAATSTPTASSSSSSPASLASPAATSASPTPLATTASPTPASASPSPSAVVSASSRVTSSWSTGYCAAVTLTSTAKVTSWTVQLPARGRPTSVWGASGSSDGTALRLSNLSWNGVVTPSAPVTSPGYCLTTG